MKAHYTFLVRFKGILILFFLLIACSQDSNDTQLPNEAEDVFALGKEEILFIGNSHTFYNQGIYSHLGKFRDNDNLDFKPLIQEAARGGYTLEDHLGDQITLDKINERSWDVIILQENTFIAEQALPSSIEAMKSFAELVKQKGTKVYLFMTWPYKDQREMLAGIQQTYQKGALETGAEIVPVGTEWQSIDENEQVEVNLYDSDGVHPSLEGTFYAAAMFYQAIYGETPSDNIYTGGLETDIATFLKTAAN